MKKSAVLNTYLTAVMALTMTFAVACTGPGQSKAFDGQGKVQAPNTPNPQQQLDGTTDGAGGNGIDGKIYESYIVNPQELEAYKQILQPKIAHLDKVRNAKDNTEDTVPLFNIIWKFKKWYIAPVSLKSLNKKTIGVEFTKESTEQLALQTDTEVWIDSRLFEKMSLTEQAQLLMHEYVMSAYLFKFESIYDLCMLAKSYAENPEQSNCGSRSHVDDHPQMKSEPKRDLNKTDYSYIRYVTSTLMQKPSFASKKEISSLFLMNKFDSRIFSNYENSEFERVEITANEIVTALKGAAYSQTLNGSCVGLQSGIEKNCIFEVKDETPANAFGFKVLKLTLKDASTQEILRSFPVKITDWNTSKDKQTNIVDLELWGTTPDSEGAMVDGLALEFEKFTDGGAYLKQVFFVRNVVTSITIAPPQKSDAWTCPEIVSKNLSYIKTNAFEKDAIYLGTASKESLTDFNKFLHTRSEAYCKAQK